jgi:hypothetical protein
MYDAVSWRNLLGKQGYKVGYADGVVSAWPAEAFTSLENCIPWKITVLANPAHEIFDHEAGNVGPARIAEAIAARLAQGKWSIVYSNGSELPTVQHALQQHGIQFSGGEMWPSVGVYLWCAHPGTTPGHIPPWAPVHPVAVQDRWEKDWDISTVYGNFPNPTTIPAAGHPPVPQTPAPPPAPTQRTCTVNLPVLQQGAKGPPVRALQVLLGGLNADADFGPRTHSRLVAWQKQAGLAADGIVGAHTWGALLGAPQ